MPDLAGPLHPWRRPRLVSIRWIRTPSPCRPGAPTSPYRIPVGSRPAGTRLRRKCLNHAALSYLTEPEGASNMDTRPLAAPAAAGSLTSCHPLPGPSSRRRPLLALHRAEENASASPRPSSTSFAPDPSPSSIHSSPEVAAMLYFPCIAPCLLPRPRSSRERAHAAAAR